MGRGATRNGSGEETLLRRVACRAGNGTENRAERRNEALAGAVRITAKQASTARKVGKCDADDGSAVCSPIFKAVDTNNGKLSQAEFIAGSNKGLVHDTASLRPSIKCWHSIPSPTS